MASGGLSIPRYIGLSARYPLDFVVAHLKKIMQ